MTKEKIGIIIRDKHTIYQSMQRKDGFKMYEEDKVVIEKTKEETDKKCPQCGGTMSFDPKTGGMKCPYCDYE